MRRGPLRGAGPPLIVHCCHCSECQRQNGSAFAVNAVIEQDRVKLTRGAVVTAHMPAASGRGQTLHRCADCNVTLWSNYSGAGPAIAFLRVGTMDRPDAFPPDVHIYTSTKRDWVVLPTGARSFPEYYSASEVWSEDARKRYAATKA